jgi:hypothetical protein
MHNPTLNYSGARIEKHVLQVLLVFLIVNAVVILYFPLLPFIDLPNHLSEAMIFKYYDKPGSAFSSYYKPVPWFYPNTMHAVFCSWFPSVETGNKIFHILYIVFLQTSIFLVIKRLNGNQWYGLLALLFTFNYNLTFGFVGFAISIPALLFLFYFILIDIQEEKLKWKVCISILLVLLFYMHAQNALLGLLLYGIILLAHYRKNIWKAFLIGLCVSVPLLSLILIWWTLRDDIVQQSTLSYMGEYYRSEFWSTYSGRFKIVFRDNFSLFDGLPGKLVGIVFSFSLLIPLMVFPAWRLEAKALLTKDQSTQYAFLLLIGSGLCYMLLPDELPGQSPLYERFGTMVLIAFVICISVLLKDLDARFIKILSISVLAVYLILWSEYIYSFNRENRNFNKAFFEENIEKEAKLAGLIWDGDFRGRKLYIHFPNYFLVWKNGIVASKIIDYRFGIIRRVAPESEVPFYNEYAQEEYVDEYKYESVQYLLARETQPNITQKHFPTFQELKRADKWVLYKKKPQ